MMTHHMQCFSAWEYLLIDVANQWGLDKLDFPERIQWTLAHIHELERMAEQRRASGEPWKEYPLFSTAKKCGYSPLSVGTVDRGCRLTPVTQRSSRTGGRHR